MGPRSPFPVSMPHRPAEAGLRLLALTAAYVLAGKLGLMLAFVHASATAVWPPTGIALAALLVLGFRVWPAIFAGAFLVNATAAGSLATTLGITTGNTLEGLLGAYLVSRFAGGRHAFERARDIFRFVLAVLLSTTVSATLGPTSLALAGYAAWAEYGSIWLTWWLGDVAGALIVTPFLLLWSADHRVSWKGRRLLEAAVLLLSLVLVAQVVFGGALSAYGIHTPPLTFLCIPPLLWAAFRFGQREAATLTVLLSGLAIAGTLRGFGPFATGRANESLLLLQTFMASITVTALTVAALRRQSDIRFYAVAESATDAIISADARGRICYCNRSAAGIFGYTARELDGKPLTCLMPERYRTAHTAGLERLTLTGQSRLVGHTVELHGLRKDGPEFPIELSLSTWKWGEEAFYTGIIRDITDRKRAETARAQFSDNVSHELNTPLAQIRMLSETLLLGRLRSKEDRRRSLEIVAFQARRLGRVVDNLLNLSHLERESVVLALEPTNLAELVREIVDEFSPLARARRVSLRTELQEGIVASVDRSAVREVLLNLLDNAVKYGPAGQTVTVEMLVMGPRVRIRVDDEGPGIPARERERIWQRFQRLEREATSGIGGSGIGLFLVGEFVHLHGGEVWVEDAPGSGARFNVELPRVQRIGDALAAEDAGRPHSVPSPDSRF